MCCINSLKQGSERDSRLDLVKKPTEILMTIDENEILMMSTQQINDTNNNNDSNTRTGLNPEAAPFEPSKN